MPLLRKHFGAGDGVAFTIAAVFAIILIVMAIKFSGDSATIDWLNAWTDWMVKYIALAVSAIKFWQVGDAVAMRLRGETSG